MFGTFAYAHPPPPTHTCTHTLPEYPLGSFWIFIKETPTAATDRWAGVLTPGSGSLPIKTHRTKNIPPHWPRQQTFTSTKTRSLPASMSCPSCCSTQHSFKSIYMSCVINPISSGSSCSVKKKKEKEEEGKKYLFGSFRKWVSILYLFMAVYLHVICVYTYARVLQIFLPFKDCLDQRQLCLLCQLKNRGKSGVPAELQYHLLLYWYCAEFMPHWTPPKHPKLLPITLFSHL